jgi:hypothetical protein
MWTHYDSTLFLRRQNNMGKGFHRHHKIIIINNRKLNNRKILFSFHCLSYMLLLEKIFYDDNFPIHWNHLFPEDNNLEYEKLVSCYDDLDSKYMADSFKYKTQLLLSAQKVIGAKNGEADNLRRRKKRESRVYKEVILQFKAGMYGDKSDKLYDALLSFHYAFRESFIKIRSHINKEQYDLLPENLKITLEDNTTHTIMSLFIWDKRNNFYLDRDKKFTKKDLRRIQLTIAPFIFRKHILFIIKYMRGEHNIAKEI